ncbi:MAG: DNA internalization-related competence protein ComEC/Rec2 [Firmicutes bacterium]|nr:DNA internalization-related competence protein ComEC/Rec2 [Bacillota bacterium]
MAILPFVVVAFAAGIAAAARVNLPLLSLLILGLVASFTTMVMYSKKKPATAALLFLFLCLGMFSYQVAMLAIFRPLRPLFGVEGEFRGYIQEIENVDEDKIQFIFYVEEAVLEPQQTISVNTAVRVSVYHPPMEFEPTYGQLVKLRGTLSRPQAKRNPGGFDYAVYLETAGIGAMMSVKPRDLTVLEGTGGHPALAFFYTIRGKALALCRNNLPEREARLASGLVLGQKEGIEEETLAAYQRLGLAHLLAVSGLHVGFVAAFALFIFTRLCGTRWPLLPHIMGILFVLAYVFLTGGHAPVWRAALSLSIAFAARQAGRESEGILTLAVVALLMLWMRPLWLFSLSFQMSFAATTGILLIAPRIQALLTRFPKGIAGPLAIIVSAMVGVLPLQVAHFGYFSIYTIPLNLLCVPLVGIVVMVGLVGIGAGFLCLPLATPFFLTALPVLALLERLPRFVVSLPGSVFTIGALQPIWWWLYVSLLVLFLARCKLIPVTGKKILLILVVANLALLSSLPLYSQRQLMITFLDVGQGLAIHVQTPAGRHLLVDAGGGAFDVGEHVILPYLRANHVRKLDMLILTHPHEDHFGGMNTIVSQMPIDAFIDNGEQEQSASFTELRMQLTAKNIPHTVVAADYQLTLDGIQINILSPPASHFINSGDDVNNNSLVLRLSYGNFSALLMGDAETFAVTQLLQTKRGKLTATVLQVPHHGSRNALSVAFLEEVSPQVAVISVGNNVFGHPHVETLTLLCDQDIEIFRTDLHGAVTITTDGECWQSQAYTLPAQQHLP